MQDKDRWLTEYENLLWSVVNELHVQNNPDAVQEAYLGLVVARSRFDSDKGFEFSTFAVHYMKGYIRKFLHNDKLIPDKQTAKGYEQVASFDSLDRNVKGSDLEENTPLGSLVPDRSYERDQHDLMWNWARDHLTDDLKQIWDMKLEGYSCHEIGQQVGKSTPTIERLLKKACMTVRRYIDGN